jgi:hypothetical protein
MDSLSLFMCDVCAVLCESNVNPIVLSRLTSMYGSVLQQLVTNTDVRTLLNITAPVQTLAPSLEELLLQQKPDGTYVDEEQILDSSHVW